MTFLPMRCVAPSPTGWRRWTVGLHWGLFLLLVALVWGALSLAAAQELHFGTRIRLHLADGSRTVGTLHRIGPDTLWYTPRGTEAVTAVPLSSLDRLDRRVEANRRRGALKWGLGGFLVGAAVGGATCAFDPEPCKSRPDESDVGAALGSALFLGTGVGLLTAAGGLLLPDSRWRRVPPPYPTTKNDLSGHDAPAGTEDGSTNPLSSRP